jgi:transcriptional regulator with XRE-family HTH domain
VKHNPLTTERYSLGRRLRALRLEYEQTQTDVAKATLCTVTAISLWELGKTEPTLSNLIMLADHFDTTLDWLVRGKRSDGKHNFRKAAKKAHTAKARHSRKGDNKKTVRRRKTLRVPERIT